MTAPQVTSVQDAPARDIDARAERGLDLHLAKRQLIVKVEEGTYCVPSSGGQQTYTVRYGASDGSLEDCDCVDFGVHRGAFACKHIVAVALLYASRRRRYSKCEVCGVPSSEKTLMGIHNDRSRHGPRYCVPHHPESMNSLVSGSLEGLVIS
jgi:hypothetical protein